MSTDEFTNWFNFEHGTSQQRFSSDDGDSVIEDDYSETSGTEIPPLNCDGIVLS